MFFTPSPLPSPAHLLFPPLPQKPELTPHSISNSTFHSCFFIFFYTDSAEHREYYPHIYSSLDAGFLFRICSLHARPCLLPPEVKVPPSHSYLLCMCSISIDSPFYAKSAVNTRQVARLVLFMNMCPWRHPLSSGFFFFPQSPSVGSGRGVLESQTVFTV